MLAATTGWRSSQQVRDGGLPRKARQRSRRKHRLFHQALETYSMGLTLAISPATSHSFATASSAVGGAKLSYHAGRRSHSEHAGRQNPCDDRAGANHRVGADRHAGTHDDAPAEPDVVAD